MFTIIGIVIVFGAVLGGFGMAGGPFKVLVQWNELLVIGGAALGTLVISTPGKMRSRVLNALKQAFKGKVPTKNDYFELLKLQYEVYNFIRRNGPVALEAHINEL